MFILTPLLHQYSVSNSRPRKHETLRKLIGKNIKSGKCNLVKSSKGQQCRVCLLGIVSVLSELLDGINLIN